jgi:hypothetical protein
MSRPSTELSVRQHERFPCDMAIAMRIGEAFAARVRLARGVASVDGRVAGRLSSVSQGGVEIRVPLFVPVGATIDVRVADAAGKPLADITARVVRTAMLDRRPIYALGAVVDAAQAQSMTALVALAVRALNEGEQGADLAA